MLNGKYIMIMLLVNYKDMSMQGADLTIEEQIELYRGTYSQKEAIEKRNELRFKRLMGTTMILTVAYFGAHLAYYLC